MTRSLLVKSTWGPADPERAGLALTVASTALSAGVPVQLWLAADAVWLAVPGRAQALPHTIEPSIADLLTALLDGAEVLACSRCLAERDLTPADLLGGIDVAGAAQFVAASLEPHKTVLVY